jgi:hypothetical protein
MVRRRDVGSCGVGRRRGGVGRGGEGAGGVECARLVPVPGAAAAGVGVFLRGGDGGGGGVRGGAGGSGGLVCFEVLREGGG